MNIFEDSINLLKGAAFTNIKVNDSFIFLESPTIFSEYIVPLTFLDKFETQVADDLYNTELAENKNISYYVRQTLVEDYRDYFGSLKITEDYIDSYMVLNVKEMLEFDIKDTQLVEVTEENFEEYKSKALELFESWSNESDYVDYFRNLAKEESSENKLFKDYLLQIDGKTVSIASVIFDIDTNLAYLHNAGTLNEFRRNGYFNIINSFIINRAFDLGIDRVYSITEKDGESFGTYKKLGFKEEDAYYSFS